jgi:hypothetical protein
MRDWPSRVISCKLVDGQFVALQQRDDAQPRRVGQRPQVISGGGHDFFPRQNFLKKHLTRFKIVISSYLDTSICYLKIKN